jgi:hypothetical protein
VYVKGDLRIDDSSTLNITGNVRFVVGTSRRDDENIKIDRSTVTIASGGNLLFLASGNFKATSSYHVNSGGSASNLLIMTMGDIKLEDSGDLKGGLYALDDIKIQESATFTGAMAARDNIEREGSHSTVTYDPAAATGVIGNIKTC